MKHSTQRRLERLEAQQAVKDAVVGRHILLDLIDVPPDEAARRIAEAEAQKQPEDLLIIVQDTNGWPDVEDE